MHEPIGAFASRGLRPGALEMPQGIVEHPGMGAATKLCGAQLWTWAGCRPNTIAITYQHIAGALRRDVRCARDWIRELAAAGLIEIADDTPRGLRIYVVDPDTIGAPRIVAASGQRELFPAAELDREPRLAAGAVEMEPGRLWAVGSGENCAESQGVCAQKPPDALTTEAVIEARRSAALQALARDRPRAGPGETAQKPPSADLDLDLKGNLNRDLDLMRTSQAGNPEQPVRAVLARLPDVDSQAAATRQQQERLVAELLAKVPGLRSAPARKVVAAVIENRIEWSEVLRAIDNANDRVRNPDERWCYVVSAWRNKFHELGIAWLPGRPLKR